MTGDVSMQLMTDKDFLEFYNKLRVETGTIDQTQLPNGVTCNGDINVNGVIFKMFTYDEVYEDLDGTIKEFLPKGTIAFLHPGLGTTVYAQVSFVKGTSFVSYAERIVPRVVASEGDNIVEVQMFSRPVPYPLDWEGWIVCNICDPVETFRNDVHAASYSNEVPQEGVELKSAEEINAMNRKADVIAYAELIGLSTLSDKMSLDELKTAVLNYQEETYVE